MTGGIFPSTKSLDDLWCVTEMHLVNSIAVIRLDTRKQYRSAGGMNWAQAMHCLSSSFVLATAREFEGLINMQLLERSWYSYPNKSNVLDDITAMLSPLIYIRVWMYSLCQFMEEKCAFYQLPDMCFQCTWKQRVQVYSCQKPPLYLSSKSVCNKRATFTFSSCILRYGKAFVKLINWLFFDPVNGILWIIGSMPFLSFLVIRKWLILGLLIWKISILQNVHKMRNSVIEQTEKLHEWLLRISNRNWHNHFSHGPIFLHSQDIVSLCVTRRLPCARPWEDRSLLGWVQSLLARYCSHTAHTPPDNLVKPLHSGKRGFGLEVYKFGWNSQALRVTGAWGKYCSYHLSFNQV